MAHGTHGAQSKAQAGSGFIRVNGASSEQWGMKKFAVIRHESPQIYWDQNTTQNKNDMGKIDKAFLRLTVMTLPKTSTSPLKIGPN